MLLLNTPRATNKLALSTKQRVRKVVDPADPTHGVWALIVTQDPTNIRGAPYGEWVSVGRRGGRMPPYQALVPWVMIRMGYSNVRAKRPAFAIARSIGREGTQPNLYLQHTVDEVSTSLQRLANDLGVIIVASVNAQIPPLMDVPG